MKVRARNNLPQVALPPGTAGVTQAPHDEPLAEPNQEPPLDRQLFTMLMHRFEVLEAAVRNPIQDTSPLDRIPLHATEADDRPPDYVARPELAERSLGRSGRV